MNDRLAALAAAAQHELEVAQLDEIGEVRVPRRELRERDRATDPERAIEPRRERGEVVLHAKLFDGLKRGVVIAEGVWPNSAHERGEGINVLTGADAPAPYGGAAVHDNKVWVRPAPPAH